MSSRMAIACFALLSGAAAGVPAAAADLQNRVQLQVFQVKVVDPSGKVGQIPITFYIDTPGSRNAQAVCQVGPRLRDALLTHLRRETYSLDRQGKIDTLTIAEGARPVIEGAVKKDNVVGVEVSMDPPKVKPAAAPMFARIGCIGVADAGTDEDDKAKKKKK